MRHCLLLALAAPFFASCGLVHDWREMKTAPMTFGECYDGLLFIARNDGLTIDPSTSDRGLGTLQSRWRLRQLGLGRPGRYRLVAEVMIDEGTPQEGWPIRFVFEQQKVKDLRRATDPAESDWSDDGQDKERETIFGEKLVRRLGDKQDGMQAPRDPAAGVKKS